MEQTSLDIRSCAALTVYNDEGRGVLDGGLGELEGQLRGRIDHGGGKRGHVQVTRADL